MRHHYLDDGIGIHPAIADLSMVDDSTWELNRINVPARHRGQGCGSRLLRRVTTDADAEEVSLTLRPYPSGPLDYDALVSWYERNGFDFEPGATEWDAWMIRHPNPCCGLCDGPHQARHCPAMSRIRLAEEGAF